MTALLRTEFEPLIEAKSYIALAPLTINQNLNKERHGLNNLSSADEGHLGCHHRHELDIGVNGNPTIWAKADMIWVGGGFGWIGSVGLKDSFSFPSHIGFCIAISVDRNIVCSASSVEEQVKPRYGMLVAV